MNDSSIIDHRSSSRSPHRRAPVIAVPLALATASLASAACFSPGFVPPFEAIEESDDASGTFEPSDVGGPITTAAPDDDQEDGATGSTTSTTTGGAAGCGDGLVEGDELCDDANLADGDGCSSDCAVELHFRCRDEEPSACAPIRILYAPAGLDDWAFRTDVAAITHGPVVYYPVHVATPVLADLVNEYDCVITGADTDYDDGASFGDVLSSYVDAGCVVLLGLGAYQELEGSFITNAAYAPIGSTYADSTGTVHYAHDGVTPIHQGVEDYQTTRMDLDVELRGAGIQDGSFTNGVISTAFRPDFRVVYVNGKRGYYGEEVGDWPRLLANACAVGHAQ